MIKYDVVDFEEQLPPARIKRSDLRLADKIVHRDNERYDNLSHYIRCAIIKLNREEKKRLKI